MKTSNYSTRKEKGQVLVLVVIVLFALVAMTALTVDGGYLMLESREAKAAADAGALAGARAICTGISNPAGVAQSVASQNFGASVPLPTYSTFKTANDSITVKPTVSRNPFFAGILGKTTLPASASATATCLQPSQLINILPMAFYCTNPSSSCGVSMTDWGSFASTGLFTSTLYVFVNSSNNGNGNNKNTCIANGGQMNCLFNLADGTPVRVMDIGDYGWIEGVCSSGLASCIPGIINPTIISSYINLPSPNYTYTITSVSGSESQTIFDAIRLNLKYSISHQAVLFPYYSPRPTGKLKDYQLPIMGEVGFVITCVTDSDTDLKCPGRKGFDDNNVKKPPKIRGEDTVEGYFVSGYPFNLYQLNPGISTYKRVGVNYVALTK
jgi:hypothetical protein